jgi:hypothetical protein
MYKMLLAVVAATVLSTAAVADGPAVREEPLDAATLSTIKSKFGSGIRQQPRFQGSSWDVLAIALNPIGGEKRERKS